MRCQGSKYWANSCSQELFHSCLQVRPRKHSAAKYLWHRFGKSEKSWWGSKQDEWFSRSSRWSFIKKVFWEISKNFQESTCARVSFLTKLDVVDLQLHLKRTHESSSTGSFYEFYNICKELFFSRTQSDGCFWL